MSQIPIALCLVMSVVALEARVDRTMDDQPYCSMRYRRLCQGKGRHVACQFSNPGPGDSCQNYTQIKFTRELKHFITNYLNRRRQRLASGNERVRGGAHVPRPEIMMQVEWDRELSYLAQRLADQCTFVHDDCRATVRYPYAGQTVGEVKWRRTSEPDELIAQRAIRRVLDAWWGERRRVTAKQITAPFRLTSRGTIWGHFSQLAVWKLRAVGCGAVRHGVDYARLLLVCDFSHTNMLGQRTISPGPLAPCPIHTARRSRSAYPLLCGPVRNSRQQIGDDDEDNDQEDYNDNLEEEDETTKGPIELTTMSRSDLFKDEHAERQTEGIVVKYKPETGKLEYRAQDVETLREPKHRKFSDRVIIEKLQQELDRKEEMRMEKERRRTRRPLLMRWREQQERTKSEAIGKTEWPHHAPPASEGSIPVTEVRKYYRKTERTVTTTTDVSPRLGLLRHRWTHTRDRLLRPRTDAMTATTKRLPPPPPEKRLSAMVSLKMDKDDVDQLFKDTGFNPKWRQNIKS